MKSSSYFKNFKKKGKWIFCKHKKRDTWENPGGHIDEGETPLEAAKRELYEETGAIDFDIEPLCDYYINGEVDGRYFKGKETTNSISIISSLINA